MQATVLWGASFYAGAALGAARSFCCSGEVDRRRLSARILDTAFGHGVDSRGLGFRRPSPETEEFAWAGVGRKPILKLGGQRLLQSKPPGACGNFDLPQPNGCGPGVRKGGKQI